MPWVPEDIIVVAALTGKGDLTVDTGAKLHVKNIGWGKYYVTKDFANEDVADGSWKKLASWDPEASDKKVQVTQDKDGNVLIESWQDSTPVDPDNPDPDNPDKPTNPDAGNFPSTGVNGGILEVITNPDNRDQNADGVVGFINRVVEIDDTATMVETFNQASQIGAAGGQMAQGMTMVTGLMDATENHLGFEDVHFVNGEERLWDGARLWANALGQKTNVSGLDMTGTSADYDGTNYGVMLGVDLALDNGLRFGASFGAQKGDVESNNSVVTTKNEADAYSLTAYAAKRFGALNLIGHLGYTRVDSDLSQSFAGNIGSQSLDVGNDIITAGLKGEYRFPISDNAALVPYAGIRSVTFLSTDETSKINGKDGFKFETDSATQVQFPLGVALQTTHETQSGWMMRSVFDVSVTPVAGDKEVETKVQGVGLKAVDTTEAEFAKGIYGAARFGLMAEKDNFAFGGNFGLRAGDRSDADVSFGLNLRVKF